MRGQNGANRVRGAQKNGACRSKCLNWSRSSDLQKKVEANDMQSAPTLERATRFELATSTLARWRSAK